MYGEYMFYIVLTLMLPLTYHRVDGWEANGTVPYYGVISWYGHPHNGSVMGLHANAVAGRMMYIEQHIRMETRISMGREVLTFPPGYGFHVGAGGGFTLGGTVQRYSSVTTIIRSEGFVKQGPPPFEEQVLVKLHVASVLRNNIVNVFGYLLNRPGYPLCIDLFAALTDLQNAARYKRIHTAELLHTIREISESDPHNQFLKLMNALDKIVSMSLSGPVRIWLDHLNKKKVDMNKLLRPDGKVQVVSFFDNMDLRHIYVASTVTEFKESSVKLAPPPITALMGPFFGKVVGTLMDGKLKVTLPLLSTFLLHVQTSHFHPEAEEGKRFLSSVLREDRKEVRFLVAAVDEALVANGRALNFDPYQMFRFVLKLLATKSQVGLKVMNAAAVCLIHMSPISHETFNPNIPKMIPILSTPGKINFQVLFRLISSGEYPPDVVLAKEDILKFILNKGIDMNLVLDGFVSHDYSSPIDLLIALMDRILQRAPLTRKMVSIVNNVNLHLKYKYMSIKSDSVPPRGMIDIEALFDSFATPYLPKDTQLKAALILKDMKKLTKVVWDNILMRSPPMEYSRPRQRIVRIMKNLIAAGKVPKGAISNRFGSFLGDLDENGESKDCPPKNCKPGTKLPVPIKVKPLPFPPVTIPKPNITSIVTLPLNIHNVEVEAIVSCLGPKVLRDVKLRALVLFLQGPKLTMALGPKFNFRAYITNGELMTALLTHAVTSKTLTKGEIVLLRYWIPKVNLHGLGATKVRYVKHVTVFTIDLNKMFEALDVKRISTDGKYPHLTKVYDFFMGSFKINDHLKGFDYQKTKTKRDFLMAMFKHLLGSKSIPRETKEAMKVVQTYVLVTGPGAAPVAYSNAIHSHFEVSKDGTLLKSLKKSKTVSLKKKPKPVKSGQKVPPKAG